MGAEKKAKKKKKKKEAEEKKEDGNGAEEKKQEEETWEEPEAPQDNYKKVMESFCAEAQSKAMELKKACQDTDTGCRQMVISMGEKLTDKYTLNDFWKTLQEIYDWWIEADKALKKIESDKAKELAKKEAKAKKKKKKAKL